MDETRPHSLALALPLLLGMLLYAPAFFGDQAYGYVLGIDQVVSDGVSWRSPLGGLAQTLLDSFAYLHPTGLRLLGFLLVGSAALLLVRVMTRMGQHPAGAGLAAAMLMAHPATLSAVMKLDHTGLAIALVLLLGVAVVWRRLTPALGAVALMVPSLAHPIGICAWPLIWLMYADEDDHRALRQPIYLVALALPLAAWIAVTPTELNRLLALAGQTWLNLFSGWRLGEFLPWAPEIAHARLDLEGASTVLVVIFFIFTGAVALLERFGNALAASAKRFLPLAVVAPLLAGLAPMRIPVHGDPAFALPLVLGLAILVGHGVGALAQRQLGEDNLTGAVAQTGIVALLTAGVFFFTSNAQVPLFRDGQVFWQVQRSRHDAAPQSRLGYARAVLFWATDPRLIKQGDVDILPAIKAAQILDNLFESLGEGGPLTSAQEAEAHWLFSVALTPHFVNDHTTAVEHLEQAVKLAPNNTFYAEELERTKRFGESYRKRLTSCHTVSAAEREKYRTILMKQAEVLAKAGLIESTVRKYHDALGCDPNHGDGYKYLSRALTSIGKHTEAIELLQRRPEALKLDLGLMEQMAYIMQNRPSPKGADAKAQLRWRSQQRAAAQSLWLEVARQAPKRPMAWLNLSESALLDGRGAAQAKAYFNKAIENHPELVRKGRVRQLKDRIDQVLKPGTPIPEVNLGTAGPADAGPADDGGTP